MNAYIPLTRETSLRRLSVSLTMPRRARIRTCAPFARRICISFTHLFHSPGKAMPSNSQRGIFGALRGMALLVHRSAIIVGIVASIEPLSLSESRLHRVQGALLSRDNYAVGECGVRSMRVMFLVSRFHVQRTNVLPGRKKLPELSERDNESEIERGNVGKAMSREDHSSSLPRKLTRERSCCRDAHVQPPSPIDFRL